MGFLSPWYFAGAALLGLPVWLHLLRRRRSQPLEFSSLMLFERRAIESVRHRKLEHLLLLMLRLLLLALLLFAFAQPFVERDPAIFGRGRVLVVVDASASMAAGARMEQARSEARKALDGAPAAAKVQIASLGSRLTILTRPEASADERRAAAAGLRATPERGAFGEFARAVRAFAEGDAGGLEVHLVSDMQRAGLPGGFSELNLDSRIKLVLHPIDTAPRGNYAVERVTAPARADSPETVRVEAAIAGFQTPAGTVDVALVVNGKETARRSVALPASGRAKVEFQGLPAGYGFNRCSVRIAAPDALTSDNEFLFGVERTDPRKVLVLEGPRAERSRAYLRAALEASAGASFALETRPVSAGAGDGFDRYAFVLLNDPPPLNPAFETSLRRYVEAGGALAVTLGASAGSRLPVTGATGGALRTASRAAERFFTASTVDALHPILEAAPRWESVRFYQAALLPGDSLRVLLRLNDGAPLLAEQKQGEGRIVWFASTFDNVANDLPLRPVFVPFLEGLARYLAGEEVRAAQASAGDLLELRATERAAGVEVMDPRGARALSLSQGAAARSFRFEEAGFFEVRRGGGRRELVAVNVDRRESDLTPLAEEALQLWQGGGGAAAGSQSGPGQPAERRPHPVGAQVLWCVAAAALIESVLASRTFSRDARNPVGGTTA